MNQTEQNLDQNSQENQKIQIYFEVRQQSKTDEHKQNDSFIDLDRSVDLTDQDVED